MNILIVNDDGISSELPFRLKNILQNYGNVYMCLPCRERTGSSHSTDKTEIQACNLSKVEGHDNVYTHTGTASDSVKFFFKFVSRNIDLVVSGINAGFNLGLDILYSGTVGAALEANIWGVKSIALSARKGNVECFDKLDSLLFYLLKELDWQGANCLNVNFPDQYAEGNVYKFVPAATVRRPDSGENDYVCCRLKNYITISPLSFNPTDGVALKRLQKSNGF